MRTPVFAGILAVTTGLLSTGANAVPQPGIEIIAGPAATIAVTSGSDSLFGVTALGAPLVGSAGQPELQVGGSVTASLFNPLTVEITEFNLFGLNALASFSAAIAGTLPPGSSVSWSAYFDAGNNAFGTGELIGSGRFADPSPITPIDFSAPKTATGPVTGLFSLNEFLTITAPLGETVTFSSSIIASLNPIPEPGAAALLGASLLGLGLTVRPSRRTRAAR